MAISSCVKCSGTLFELQSTQNKIRGSNYKYEFVQCVSCGGVVGVLDYHNIGHQNEQIMSNMEKVDRRYTEKMNSLIDAVNYMARKIDQLSRS